MFIFLSLSFISPFLNSFKVTLNEIWLIFFKKMRREKLNRKISKIEREREREREGEKERNQWPSCRCWKWYSLQHVPFFFLYYSSSHTKNQETEEEERRNEEREREGEKKWGERERRNEERRERRREEMRREGEKKWGEGERRREEMREGEKDPSFSPTFLPPETGAFFSSIFSTDFLGFLLPWHHEAACITWWGTGEWLWEREERNGEREREREQKMLEKRVGREAAGATFQILSLSSLSRLFFHFPSHKKTMEEKEGKEEERVKKEEERVKKEEERGMEMLEKDEETWVEGGVQKGKAFPFLSSSHTFSPSFFHFSL